MSDDAKTLTTAEVEETIERVRRLAAERDAALGSLEIAQTVEADLESHVSRTYASLEAIGARAEKAEAERDAALARVAELEKAEAERATPSDWPCLDCQPESPAKAGLKTLVAELVDASERLLEHYSDGIPDHLVDEFRAALEKAKGETR